MPIHTNTIDAFEFRDIQGNLQPKSPQLEVLVRGGHAGESIRTTGTRGVPCQIRTLTYQDNWDNARDALIAYTELKDGTPYEIVQHSSSMGLWKVLDVVQESARACMFQQQEAVQRYCIWTVVSTNAS